MIGTSRKTSVAASSAAQRATAYAADDSGRARYSEMVPCRRSRENSTGACAATKMLSRIWVLEA